MVMNTDTVDKRTALGVPSDRSYVDWAAIAAGFVVAVAVSFVFMSFGSAIGLSLASPYHGEGVSVTVFMILTALWVLFSQVAAFLVGGYVTGRLRRGLHDSTPHESDMRDGMHGLVMWGIGILIAALFASYIATNAVATGAGAAAGAASGVASAAPSASNYYLDRLLRAADPAKAAGTTTGAGQDSTASTTMRRDELGRLISTSLASGTLSTDDRGYAANLIAQQTGLTPEEAQKRVEQVYADAKAAADTARKYAMLLAFLTAATLLISALAAWFGAVQGGDQRDKGTHFPHVVRWK